MKTGPLSLIANKSYTFDYSRLRGFSENEIIEAKKARAKIKVVFAALREARTVIMDPGYKTEGEFYFGDICRKSMSVEFFLTFFLRSMLLFVPSVKRIRYIIIFI